MRIDDLKMSFRRFRTGEQYCNALYLLIGKYCSTNDKWLLDVEMPSYYCSGLAVESFIKSYHILTFSDTLHTHDLKSLLDYKENNAQKFFNLSENELAYILKLNERYFFDLKYGGNDLRYFYKDGWRESPHPDYLYKVIKKMEGLLKVHFNTIKIDRI